MKQILIASVSLAVASIVPNLCNAWSTTSRCNPSSWTTKSRTTLSNGWPGQQQPQRRMSMSTSARQSKPNVHGENSCFMPLQQLEQDYYAPRIVQIAGPYPGLTAEDFAAVTSEPPAVPGQWTYDFSDPDGPQVGTVAIEGSNVVSTVEDPVAIIAEHTAVGVPMPPEITEAVDLVLLVDRAKTGFAERKFLVMDMGDKKEGGGQLTIGAYPTFADMPKGTKILGQVELVNVPWLPSMDSTRSGILEVDEYF